MPNTEAIIRFMWISLEDEVLDLMETLLRHNHYERLKGACNLLAPYESLSILIPVRLKTQDGMSIQEITERMSSLNDSLSIAKKCVPLYNIADEDENAGKDLFARSMIELSIDRLISKTSRFIQLIKDAG